MIRTEKQALALLEKSGRLALSGPGSLVEAVAGPVRGSWWAHPQGAVIFRLATALHDHPDVVALKLDGRVRFVPRWTGQIRPLVDAPKPATSWSTRDA